MKTDGDPSPANLAAAEWTSPAVYIPFGANGGNPSIPVTTQGAGRLAPLSPGPDLGHVRRGPEHRQASRDQRIGPTLRPAAESAINASRRRARVAACFALVTQCVTARR